MKLLRLHIVQLLLMALMVLSATTSCNNYDQSEADLENPYASRYINITVAVSTSEQHGTRAPLGGEYGDAIEKGATAENKVNNITLIFYEDATGINTTSDDAEVACVKSYAVTPVSTYTPDDHEHEGYETTDVKNNEVLYTTGDQRLDETTLVAGKTYRVLVAANVSLPVNVGDKIKTVRDLLYSNTLYTTENGTPTDFVMTSESDATVSLTNPTQKTAEENRFVYNFNCIHIERLAARIDYNTSGATYDEALGGYKYPVGTGDDFFVVTKVTPFNLYNESEYFFKRVRSNWTDATPVFSWLDIETLSNYVVDPNTGNKDNSHTFSYLSPIAEDMDNGYTQTMSSEQNKNKENTNIVISYARENTLMPTSPLKKYATGLAFEIKYYINASATPVTHVYYHYLRHQGELSIGSYQAYQWDELSSDMTCGSSPSMKYGIVRNNIYRVTVSGFTPQEGDLKITIEEKHWRHVDNPTIYI